jgi:hypothetical protein
VEPILQDEGMITGTAVMQKIKSRLEETQYKSEAPQEFEEAIADAFTFLGLEARLIGGSGDTDVLLTANIGAESFKVSVDGKTNKSGKIPDSQVNWLSLQDHRKKNRSDFVLVVGVSFASGNLESRARELNVSLLKTDDLVKLLEAHAAFPATLTELKDLFSGYGDVALRVDDLITQMAARRDLIMQFKTVVDEMHAVQDGKLGYFTLQSLVAREKVEEMEDITPEEIKSMINLLQLPFIDGINSASENEFLMVIGTKDLANIFFQISQTLLTEHKTEPKGPHTPPIEPKRGTKYFKWEITKNSVVSSAREENPYFGYCPIEHFKTLIYTVVSIFKDQDIINKDILYMQLVGKDLAPGRPFKGHQEEYKLYMALGILELEGLLKWTGSKRPVEYTLNVPLDVLKQWCKQKFLNRLI